MTCDAPRGTIGGEMTDTIEAVEADATGVFGYSKGDKPQDRAHAYLARHLVKRGYSDTAMECAALDMVRRAYDAGVADGAAETQADVMERMAESLLADAERLRV